MKNVKKAVCGLLLFVVLLATADPGMTVSAAGSGSVNNMNVVFVLDGSGSMFTTDKDQLRFEALELFLGLSTESGNYMGAVVFDDHIILKRDIARIDGKSDKSELSEEVQKAVSKGDTDIGSAILEAVRMLKQSGSSGLPSAIILLSDGNTDLPKDRTGAKLAESEHRKAAAIDYARQKEIGIHSVCLNANGKAKKEELQEISDATGGTCVEVKRAKDLKDVFHQFYNIIYSTKTRNLIDTKIPKSGELKVPFTIPVIGVKEANIIINTMNPNTSYNLFHPQGYGYTRAELEEMAIQAKTFTVIKIEKPEPGDWELVVRGAQKDQVKIDMVYNTDLSLEPDTQQIQTNGQKVLWQLSVQVDNEGAAVTNEKVYQQYPFWAVVTDRSTGDTQKLELTADGAKSVAEFETEGYGKYKVQAFCEIDDMKVRSGALTVQKENTAPEWQRDPIVIEEKTHLLSQNLYTLDLNTVAADAEGDRLEFQITDSGFGEEEVRIADGSKLTVKIKSCGNGSLTVAAVDQAGMSAQVKIEIKTTSVTGQIVLVILGIILLAVFILCIPLLRSYLSVVRGTVQILTYGDQGTDLPVTFDGEKGRMVLSRYIHPSQNIGIRLEACYLTAGEKNSCIYLLSSDGYYSDQDDGQKKKKICIRAGVEVNISSDIDFTNGMRIIYMPYQETDGRTI
ncbi:MAG: VWA domain-containing protein [Eubacterium sp.]|nr:VWA domain-containing protein [Eubacterium sp.]